MLRNPAYAGIYAYGRSRTDLSRWLPGREHSRRVRGLDAGQWLVRIEGALPASSALGSTRGTRRGWPPTGPAPRAWARCVKAPRCWAGWWPAGSAVTACK